VDIAVTLPRSRETVEPIIVSQRETTTIATGETRGKSIVPKTTPKGLNKTPSRNPFNPFGA